MEKTSKKKNFLEILEKYDGICLKIFQLKEQKLEKAFF